VGSALAVEIAAARDLCRDQLQPANDVMGLGLGAPGNGESDRIL
jgi:hypothetical protein